MTDNFHNYCRCIQQQKTKALQQNNYDESLRNSSPPATSEIHRHFFSFNHLLFGAGHHKEKAMLKAAKSIGLQGAILYGTPGIIIVDAIDADSLTSFENECRTIGKKASLVLAETVGSPASFSCASDSKGLVVLPDYQSLRTIVCEQMGLPESDYMTVLGVKRSA
jgi:hypothetical protein